MIKPVILTSLFFLLCRLALADDSMEAPNMKVPEWSKQAVWYQIFPERFRNGDSKNDPALADIIGSWPHDSTSPIFVHPWTSDWYARQSWEQDNKGFYFHVQRRRYGGDLQGIIDELDYLTDLGVNALYLNPVFESPSLHKYDAATYHHIDDNFGPNPQRDKQLIASERPDDPATWKWTTADSLFLILLQKCHQRNIRVIIDGVWNHVGMTFGAFKDVIRNQQKSPYAQWFYITSWDDPATPQSEFGYKGWWDVNELPELQEDENGFQPQAWQYMQHAIRRWMDPNADGDPADGIDGWRLDAATEVHFASWRQFRKLVRSINPQAYLSGEIWWEHWPTTMYNAAPWLQGDVFDAAMNYRFARNIVRFFINKEKRISISQFDSVFAAIREQYPVDAQYALQNLVDSHDTDRIGSMILNPDRVYGHQHKVQENPAYIIRKPNEREIQIQKLIVLFQVAYLGAPMIYYGDEAGMWGASDPDERKPMLWPDLRYDDESHHPLGQSRPRDKNEFDRDLFSYYQRLIRIRKNNPELSLGSFKALVVDDEADVYAFERTLGSGRIVVLLNNSLEDRSVNLRFSASKWRDLLDDRECDFPRKMTVRIKAKSGRILKQL